MELRKLLEIILRRKWLIIQAFVVIFGVTIAISCLVPRVYVASARVLIKASSSASMVLSGIGMSDLSSLMGLQGSSDSANITQMATSEPFLRKVIERLQLVDASGNVLDPTTFQSYFPIFYGIFPHPYVEVVAVEDTTLFDISAKSGDPEDAAMIANTLAEIYMQENQSQRREEFASARQFIDSKIDQARKQFETALEDVKKFKLENTTLNLQTEVTVAINKMAELMQQKEENLIDLVEVRARIGTLKEYLAQQNAGNFGGSALSENPILEELKKNLIELEIALIGELADKKPDHPDVVVLQAKIKKTKDELTQAMGGQQSLDKALQDYEQQLAAFEVHLVEVNKDIEQYKEFLTQFPAKEEKQSQLTLKVTAGQELYSNLLESQYQIGMAEAMILSDLRMVEAAMPTAITKPDSPKLLMNGIIGAFLGLIFAFGLAFVVEYLDDSVETPSDVRGEGLTLLGTVPKMRKREGIIITKRERRDPVCESYRTIRNSIKFVRPDAPVRSFLVTGSLAGVGKSVTVANLGISFAHEGARVLLVDLDLRKPKLHELFALSNAKGVTTLLTDDRSAAAETVQPTATENLFVLTSGPIPPDPGTFVESQKLKRLITELSQQYDHVILDSPPVLAANDAILLSEDVDGTILVLESRKDTHRSLHQTREAMKLAKVRLAGVILNKFRSKGDGYYYNYYSKSGYHASKKT